MKVFKNINLFGFDENTLLHVTILLNTYIVIVQRLINILHISNKLIIKGNLKSQSDIFF